MDVAIDGTESKIHPAVHRINFVERFIRGNKDFVILFLISKRPMSGSDIIREIFSISNVFLHQGSVYPTVYFLEEKEFIRAKYERGDMKKKIYYITPSGQSYVQSLFKDLTNSIFHLNSMMHSAHMLTEFDCPMDEFCKNKKLN
jgi:DNA-binding PadR family transcriptional regulator